MSFLLQWNWFVTSKSEQKHDICQNAAKLAERHCDRACLTAQLHTDQGGPDYNQWGKINNSNYEKSVCFTPTTPIAALYLLCLAVKQR